ncbi:hypothetical protein GUJ93_ZPchr0013g34602 [Zizania palustris]|uniref:Rad60/SUMO-like domain-containing protein n=1 Tax=Zizania palustris TaxID=103762 RepID=A0A8J5X128_ZIZPA|nr:hypothetical protein GUJ93_ZPchr0013g34602 [Zizania palustris]
MSLLPEIKPDTFITLSVKDGDGVRITRTMRSTDMLCDLTDFYLAMVSADGNCACDDGVFMYYGRMLRGKNTPTDYEMEDGDEITFFPFTTNVGSVFVTLTIKFFDDGCSFTSTMRRTNRLQDLIDYFYAMFPAERKGDFMYYGVQIEGEMTPSDYFMKDGDEITFLPVSKPSVFVTLKIKGDDRCSFTRTVRTTDRLQDLIDIYNAMVPAGAAKNGDFMYNGSLVDGEKSPSDYDMEDGDEIAFIPISKRGVFVTLKIKCDDGCIVTRTMRRTDKLQVLIDFYDAMVPGDANYGFFMYNRRQVDVQKTPRDYMMEDGDLVVLCHHGSFVTVNVAGPDNFKHRHTLRWTDELQDLFELCSFMVISHSQGPYRQLRYMPLQAQIGEVFSFAPGWFAAGRGVLATVHRSVVRRRRHD